MRRAYSSSLKDDCKSSDNFKYFYQHLFFVTNLELETHKKELEIAIKKFIKQHDLVPVVVEWSQYFDNIEVHYEAK